MTLTREIKAGTTSEKTDVKSVSSPAANISLFLSSALAAEQKPLTHTHTHTHTHTATEEVEVD